MPNNAIFAALLGAVGTLAVPSAAQAAPGLGDEVYAATVNQGEAEFESHYGRLGGNGPAGSADGEDALKLEAAYGVSHNLRVAVLGEFTRDPRGPRRADSAAIEAVYALGQVGGIDVALYGEYEVGFLGPDKIETKLLLQRRTKTWDLRVNLVGEKALTAGERVELGYAASADVAVAGDFRVGVQGYGELGTFYRFAPRAQHYAGPVAKFEIEGVGPEVGVELGYLFALGAAKDSSDGMFRVRLDLEF